MEISLRKVHRKFLTNIMNKFTRSNGAKSELQVGKMYKGGYHVPLVKALNRKYIIRNSIAGSDVKFYFLGA